MRCEFCDTPYTSWEPVGEWRTIAEIVAAMPAAARHVVVTGGEPMLWPNLPRLTAALRAGGRHLTIETAGVVYQSLECDLMSISPKLGNSDPDPKHGAALRAEHRARRIDVDVLTRLMGSYTFQLKLVIARPEDLGEVDELLGRLPPVAPSAVVLMPLGVDVGRARRPWSLARRDLQGARLSLYAAVARRSLRQYPRHVSRSSAMARGTQLFRYPRRPSRRAALRRAEESK